jgi:hypothetical protein
MVSMREAIGFLALIAFVYVVGTSSLADHGLSAFLDSIGVWWARVT